MMSLARRSHRRLGPDTCCQHPCTRSTTGTWTAGAAGKCRSGASCPGIPPGPGNKEFGENKVRQKRAVVTHDPVKTRVLLIHVLRARQVHGKCRSGASCPEIPPGPGTKSLGKSLKRAVVTHNPVKTRVALIRASGRRRRVHGQRAQLISVILGHLAQKSLQD
jgi:hypothetical protein